MRKPCIQERYQHNGGIYRSEKVSTAVRQHDFKFKSLCRTTTLLFLFVALGPALDMPIRKRATEGSKLQDNLKVKKGGPIGSKIPVTNVWESYTDTGLQTSSHYLPAETRTSHFLTSLTDPMSAMQINKPNPVSPPPYGFDNVWEKQNPSTAMDNKICAQETRQKLFSESWPESLWDPLYTPAAVYPQPATASVWGNFVNSVCSPHSVTPPAPEHDKENTATLDQSDSFNPFHSLNNIWSPLPSETWGTLATGKNE
uniref:Uncharacterized protein n=1 Tax=Timema genevievae TaxID=629358 RepID=A0A7R9JSL1_TIMGE|nr:unnamed protein product [Timema genevievae]